MEEKIFNTKQNNMKTFHGKQKVKIKRIIARLKREYFISKDSNILLEMNKLYFLLYHRNMNNSWFYRKKLQK